MDFASHKDTVSVVQGLVAIAQSAITIVALVAALFWFWHRRQLFPRANLTQVVTHRRLTDAKTLVHVSLLFKNDGLVLIRPANGHVEMCQIVPVPEYLADAINGEKDPVPDGQLSVAWCHHGRRTLKLEDREIEPGEADEIHCEFVVGNEVRTVLIESHIGNRNKRRWLPWWRRLLDRARRSRWGKVADKLPAGKSIGWNASAFHDLIDPDGEEHVGSDTSVASTA